MTWGVSCGVSSSLPRSMASTLHLWFSGCIVAKLSALVMFERWKGSLPWSWPLWSPMNSTLKVIAMPCAEVFVITESFNIGSTVVLPASVNKCYLELAAVWQQEPAMSALVVAYRASLSLLRSWDGMQDVVHFPASKPVDAIGVEGLALRFEFTHD